MMIEIKLSINRTSLLAGWLMMALLVGLVAARRPFANPTAVATINLSAVLDGLNERADAQAGLDASRASFETETEEFRTKMKDLEDRYAVAAEEDKVAIQNEIGLLTVQFDHFQQYSQTKLDVEKALIFQRIYRNIRDAAQTMADAEGFDLVVVDDSSTEFSMNRQLRVSLENQVKQQITSRRIIYANPAVDITKDLIVRMNNTREAG